jgi:hypothetical protein
LVPAPLPCSHRRQVVPDIGHTTAVKPRVSSVATSSEVRTMSVLYPCATLGLSNSSAIRISASGNAAIKAGSSPGAFELFIPFDTGPRCPQGRVSAAPARPSRQATSARSATISRVAPQILRARQFSFSCNQIRAVRVSCESHTEVRRCGRQSLDDLIQPRYEID